MCPQKYRVYIGPYVAGPAASAGTPAQTNEHDLRSVSGIVQQTFLDLLPPYGRRQSGALLFVELLAAGVLLVSVIASVFGGDRTVVAGLVGVLSLLAMGAFVCGVTSCVVRRRRDRQLDRAANHAEPLAYRLVDYQAPGYAGPKRKGSRFVINGPELGQFFRMEALAAEGLQAGDVILVETGQVIPADGTILEGAATVDESVVTGESAPVLREHGSVEVVMRGTSIVEGRIVIEVAAKRGHPLDWWTAPPQTSMQPR